MKQNISYVLPIYNEGGNIDLFYKELSAALKQSSGYDYELIFINDGSKDDSLQKLIDAYDLQPVDFYIDYKIKSKPIRNVYKSVNPAFYKVTKYH